MGRRLILKVILSVCFTFNVLAIGVKNNLNRVKKSIIIQEKKIIEIKKELISLEKTIGKKNNNYIKNHKAKKIIESKLSQVTRSLKDNESELKKAFLETKKALGKLILNERSLKMSEDDLFSEKLFVLKFKVEADNLSQEINRNKILKKDLEVLKLKYESLQGLEISINRLIVDMIAQKKTLANYYYDEINAKSENEKKLSLLRAKLIRERRLYSKQKMPMFFGRLNFPVEHFTSMKTKNKGVTFKIKSQERVRATYKGKVAFAGPLGGFGNVVMIDHGDDIRSVILGKFKIKVKSGDSVTKNDILGVVFANKFNSKEIYFELRKKNKPLKTLSWVNNDQIKI